MDDKRIAEIKGWLVASGIPALEFQQGSGDWGMPVAHALLCDGEILAEVFSVQPYCCGASHRDKHLARSRGALARLFQHAPADIRDLLAEVERLTGAAEADEQRLIAAAERAGIVYVGCDTPDALAGEVVTLRDLAQRQHELLADIEDVHGHTALLDEGRKLLGVK